MPARAAITSLAMEQGKGILRLAPNWVPRSFCVPGRRIKLHPDDYYALGAERGGIVERWLASTTSADNGPLTSPDEGLSFAVVQDGSNVERFLLRAAVEELKGELIGERVWKQYRRWPVFSKLFDNKNPLPFHVHHRQEHAARVNQMSKPEAYYFPPQLNTHGGDFPHTFFGLAPGTTKEQVRECLVRFTRGDNKITGLSQAYRLEPGTGWDVPAGVLHAPGSLCTYEPQSDSDILSMYQSVVGGWVVPEELLWKDMPPEEKGNFDYLLEVIDWERNVAPDFAAKRRMEPRPVRSTAEMEAEGYIERWICYRSTAFSAKELTVSPGHTVTVRDAGAYGLIVLQGHGKFGPWEIESPALIRYGQLTNDEFFVSEAAAREGVTISNPSSVDPIVMLKHFGPKNPELHP